MFNKKVITKCSQEVRNLALESFKLPTDGRKWKQAARTRKAVLLHLASYANPDGTFIGEHGTNFSPSHEKLIEDFAKGTLHYATTALQDLGLLSWTREEKHYGRRTYVIHLAKHSQDSSEQSQEHSQDSQITLSTFEPKTQEHSQRSQITLSTSDPIPSLPTKPTAPTVQKATSAEGDSSKATPAVNEVKGLIEKLVGIFVKARGKVIGTQKVKNWTSPTEIISTLTAKHGAEIVERMWTNFVADSKNLDGLKIAEYAWVKFEDQSPGLAQLALEPTEAETKQAKEIKNEQRLERKARTEADDDANQEAKMKIKREEWAASAAFRAAVAAGQSL